MIFVFLVLVFSILFLIKLIWIPIFFGFGIATVISLMTIMKNNFEDEDTRDRMQKFGGD